LTRNVVKRKYFRRGSFLFRIPSVRKWMNSCLFCVIRRQAFLFVFWNWLYSSVHYLFFCCCFSCFRVCFFTILILLCLNLLLKAFFYKRHVSYFL
jgi:hypothetical protein